MADVIYGSFVTKLETPVSQILDRAAAAGLKSIMVLGYREDGSEYFSASSPSGPDALWLMDSIKAKLLSVGR